MGKRRNKLTGFKKTLSDEEVKRILEHFKGKDERYYLIFCFCAIGLRVGEVCMLRRSNLNAPCNVLTYFQHKTGKYHTRLLPDWLTELLLDYVKEVSSNRYLFPKQRKYRAGDPIRFIQPKSVEWELMQARRTLGLNDFYHVVKYSNGREQKLYRVTPHAFRHWASQKIYIASEHDVITTASIIGHDPETSMRYYIAPEKEFEKKKVNEIFSAIA